jgi:hypothetical protein
MYGFKQNFIVKGLPEKCERPTLKSLPSHYHAELRRHTCGRQHRCWLAAFGFPNPLLAAFIHVSSEMAFFLNSARLLPRVSSANQFVRGILSESPSAPIDGNSPGGCSGCAADAQRLLGLPGSAGCSSDAVRSRNIHHSDSTEVCSGASGPASKSCLARCREPTQDSSAGLRTIELNVFSTLEFDKEQSTD